VNCAGCVGTTDIADAAVGSSKINPAQVQIRVAGSCAIGSSIATINQDGTVVCDTDEVGIAAVTASAPLVSSGGSSPNISLPGVIIDTTNAAIGQGALFNNTVGHSNTASGFQALYSNTTGHGNTASGIQALFNNTTSHNNTAIGAAALYFNKGTNNTASGAAALYLNTSGGWNTANGHSALYSNTTGNGNTASGIGALVNNSVGNENTASGQSALGSNSAGDGNTASGTTALYSNTTGNNNTASGASALFSNTTGDGNTAVGWGADVSAGNLVNATAIGAGAIVNASNKIRLGNSAISVIEAQVGITVVSDATKKENFRLVDGESVLGKIQGLSLTSWNLIGQDPKQFRHYGPIAQEFFAAFGSDGVGTIGNPTTITSTDMDGILMVAAQALEKRTAEQTEQVSRLKAENATLKARLEALETLVTEALRK
jgi:hypothetical protein